MAERELGDSPVQNTEFDTNPEAEIPIHEAERAALGDGWDELRLQQHVGTLREMDRIGGPPVRDDRQNAGTPTSDRGMRPEWKHI